MGSEYGGVLWGSVSNNDSWWCLHLQSPSRFPCLIKPQQKVDGYYMLAASPKHFAVHSGPDSSRLSFVANATEFYFACFFTQTRSLRILPSPIRNTNTMLKRTWNHASLFVFLFHRGYLEVFDRKSRPKANPTSQTTFYYKLCFEIAGIDPISTWWPIIPRFYSY